MGDRDDLAIRAEVLSKLADQLGEQLAVERRANDELRSLLRDGPTMSTHRQEEPVCVAPVATTLAAVAVGMSICAAVAASWIGSHAGATCAVDSVAQPAAISAVIPMAPPPPSAYVPITPVESGQDLALLTGNPRDCGRITSVRAARCFVQATGDQASGEYMLRNLILAQTLLGDRARARTLASRYFMDYGASPFAMQIRQLGYSP